MQLPSLFTPIINKINLWLQSSFYNLFCLTIRTINLKFIFYAAHKKSIRSSQSAINVDIVFPLIRKVNVAISASSIIFTNHPSIVGNAEFFHLCAYNNIALYYIKKQNLIPFFQPFAYQLQKKCLWFQLYINF